MDIAEFEGIPHSKVPEDFRLEAGQEACSLAMINNVLVGEIFGSGTAVNAPGLHSHVAIHDGLLPGMRRPISPEPRLPQSRVRRRTAPAPAERTGDGCGEPTELGGPCGADEQCIHAQLLAGRAHHAQEATEGTGPGYGEWPDDHTAIQGGAVSHRPGRDGGDPDRAAHATGDGQDRQGQGPGGQIQSQEGGDQSFDRSESGLSHSVKCLQRGGRHEHGVVFQEQDDDVLVEEAPVAVEGEEGRREHHAGRTLEAKSPLVGDVLVGSSGGVEAKDACPGGMAPDVEEPDWEGDEDGKDYDFGEATESIMEDDYEAREDDATITTKDSVMDSEEEEEWGALYAEDRAAFKALRERDVVWKETRPPRGLTQKLKKGLQQAVHLMARVKKGARTETKFMVLELFSGSSMLTQVAAELPGWGAYQPVDVILGAENDMAVRENRERVKNMVRTLKPDLVVITPPCGPWCAWQRIRQDWDTLGEVRRKQLPFWKLGREVWDIQDGEGRLCLTEQPEGSEALETKYMIRRAMIYRVVVDQCVFGLKDPVSHKLYRKTTDLDVNKQSFAVGLAGVPRCSHQPREHEQIRGTIHLDGETVSRSTVAARWTREFATYILQAAQKSLAAEALREQDPLEGDQTPTGGQPRQGSYPMELWGAYPVEVEEGVVTPEEILRRQMRQMGAEGERYDYVLFEGNARLLPRRTRAILAHLHVALGHLSNERLLRMVSLAGGGSDLLEGIRNMRCQVCSMVQPPGSKPQVSYTKPTNFNQRISGDVFYVWDIKGVRYAVVHYIDELTDYHVGALAFESSSDWAAETLCRLWYDVFGPPDLLITDGGTEFLGSITRLNDIFAVQHEVVPDQAKWRLGHAERHGSIIKVMLMKMIQELRIDSLKDMQTAACSCFASKNRIVGKNGVAPIQAVTGRNTSLPGSLLAQITSGKVKFRANEQLAQEEALRRSERIRAAAIEACHWLDSHEGLRRALAARSKPPMLELLREGAVVYVYDPPANRRGLARRLQDNVSWSGPAVVVCVERDGTVPKKVWVRIRTRVKAYPLEKIRLATADEMMSADFIVGALKDVETEITQGRMPVTDYDEKKDTDTEEQKAEEPQVKGLREEVEKKRELTHDVPEALRIPEEVEPHLLPFNKKQKLFEQLAKDLGAPSAMQEAEVRNRLENAYGHLKKVRKDLKKEQRDKGREASRAAPATPSRAAPSTPAKAPSKSSAQETHYVEEFVAEEKVDYGVLWSEIETHALLWEATEEEDPKLLQVIEKGESLAAEESKAVFEAKLVTGKLRVEYQWRQLDENWRKAYEQPLIKAVQVYFDHDAITGVAKDAIVDPRKILSSRFVLTNKGGEVLAEAELKARWILGGHRDAEAGKYPTLAPTASLLGHNLLNFVAVQMGWEVHYEDVSAAFLQGQPLPAEREVYVRLPTGYPQAVTEHIIGKVGTQCRGDLLRLLKGGFGLCESPRLWYLEYKATLKSIDLHELKLIPGMFVAHHPDGRLRAVVTIHVDDTRYAGDESAEEIWDKLHERLKFVQHRRARDGWQKFCGRYERQDPETLEFYYTMADYIAKIPEILKEEWNPKKGDLTERERVKIGSILGQVNWAARQGRYDLIYGVSHCQQLVATGKREAMEWTAKLIQGAQKEVVVKLPKLGCDMSDLIVISASDAAFAAQPKGHSQGGVVCMLAHPNVLEEKAPVGIVEAQSMKIQRVVRCSMSAELSMAAESFEHGDFVRAVLSEIVHADFSLPRWKWYASRWKHYLVIDAKTGYDVLASESMTSDRKILIDAAVLREALIEEGAENFVRWMPGKEMVSDGLTKWSDNGVLLQVLREGLWSLVDTAEARRLRQEAAERKKRYVQQTRADRSAP